MYIIEIGVGIGFDFLLSPLPIVAEQVFAPSILHEMAHSKFYNLQTVETGRSTSSAAPGPKPLVHGTWAKTPGTIM